MKKITALMLTLLMLCSVFSYYVSAAMDYIIPNPPITIEVASPSVDGNITENEGWSEPAYINEDTGFTHWQHNTFQVWAEARFALNKNGFYFSANILEGVAAYEPTYNSASWTDSRCPMKGEMKDDVVPDADRFILHIDPLCKFLDGRKYGGADYVPNYTICIDEDENIHVQGWRKVITDKVIAEGSFIEGGWRFEAFIPWDVIIDDVYKLSEKTLQQVSYGDYVITADEIISHQAPIKVGLQYDDRYNGKNGERASGFTYYTPPVTRQDGMPSNIGLINGVNVLGIDLTVSDACINDSKHRWSESIILRQPTYLEKGREMTLCNVCSEVRYSDIEMLSYEDTFNDIRNGAWYYDSVVHCLKTGYMNGMSSTVFSPNTALTREQCVLMLANVMGVNTENYKNIESGFTDVPTGRWYSGAVAWAVEKGYVKGISEERFGTGQKIQRAAFVRLLYMLAEDMGKDTAGRADLSVYLDGDKVPEWAEQELAWAVDCGIITSIKTDALVLSPYTELTRAQAAVMLTKFDEIK